MRAEIVKINSENPETSLVKYAADQIRSGEVLGMAALKQSLAQMEGRKKPAATTKSEEPATAEPAKSRRKRG